MLEQQRPIAITRENYHAFCKEADLTKAEWAKWRALIAKLRAGDTEMGTFIDAHTEAEIAESQRVALYQTHDWADMVHFHDAGCALKRAQLRAYEKLNKGD